MIKHAPEGRTRGAAGFRPAALRGFGHLEGRRIVQARVLRCARGGAGSFSGGRRSALVVSGASSPGGIFSGVTLVALMYGCGLVQ